MDLSKYIYSHCIEPRQIKVWDSYSQSFKVQPMPCGKCLHCRNTYINEWVTRMYAQALDSKFTYFITLDYAPFSYEKDSFPCKTAELLASETAACWNNLNSRKQFGIHPILLKKSHLQNFLKRFRKNTGIKIQYFACGEYGTHAQGRGFGRPHFHLIVFSDTEIKHSDFLAAWTLYDYQIGNVDFVDLSLLLNNPDLKNTFKYVCKYLQKTDFDFEKLATIDFHRAYFKSLQYTGSLFPLESDYPDADTLTRNWNYYVAEYSPFCVSSKRPALGSSYLFKNIERFKKRDFRLFGLPKECITFPRYFLRKTKESLCPLVAIGSASQKPTTSSSLGYISSVLRSVYDSQLDFSNFTKSPKDFWHIRDDKFLVPYDIHNFKGVLNPLNSNDNFIPLSSLHLYDTQTNIFYQCNGFYYTAWQKVHKLGFVRKCNFDLLSIINFIDNNFKPYYNDFIVPMYNDKVLRETDLIDSIDSLESGDSISDKLANFRSRVYKVYENELANIYNKKLYMQNSKISF